MVYFDPLQVDSIYRETNRLLIASPSERIQLNLIDRFLDFIEGNETKFESYIEQILLKLPKLENPLLFAGIKPAKFENFIFKLERCSAILTEKELIDRIQSDIASYKRVLSQIYRWVGENNHDYELNDSIVKSDSIGTSNSIGHVLVPTVEEMDGVYSGRLRKLHIDIISKSVAGNKLKATFGVIGADAGSFTVDAEKAVDSLIRTTDAVKNSWKAAIHFEMPHSWHAGKSANLAIAGAFYCEILKAEEKQELFWLNPAACISGEVDPSGNVLPVSSATLNLKVEAAFFSWAHILVVPHQQVEEVHQIIEQLKTEFPNRELPVIAVSSLRDLFFDRRVTLYNKADAISHNFRKIWKRKYAAVYGLIVVLLLAVIGRLVYGPIDRNPTSVIFNGDTMFIKNISGYSISEVEVGSDMVRVENSDFHSDRYLITDVDGDRINDIIYSNVYNYRDKQLETIVAYSAVHDHVIWEKSVQFDLDYSHRPDLVDSRWNTIALYDFDSEYFLVASQYLSFFPSTLAKISKSSGEIDGILVSPGRISDVAFADVNDDGKNEMIVLASNNSYWGAVMSILDGNDFYGHLPSGFEHKAQNINYVSVKGAVLFPRTIIGSQYKVRKGTSPRLIRVLSDIKIIGAEIFENEAYGASQTVNPAIFYRLNYNLEVVGLGSNDIWDIQAREFYQNGTLSFEPGIEYLTAFKDSLLWWDGIKFVNYPTLVNRYPNE